MHICLSAPCIFCRARIKRNLEFYNALKNVMKDYDTVIIGGDFNPNTVRRKTSNDRSLRNFETYLFELEDTKVRSFFIEHFIVKDTVASLPRNWNVVELGKNTDFDYCALTFTATMDEPCRQSVPVPELNYSTCDLQTVETPK